MNTIRTTTVAAAGIAAAGLLALAAAPASAAAPHGCASGAVCFYLKKTDYDANRPTATYRAVTSGFVTLGARGKGARAVVNNRGGRVQIRFLDGGRSYTACLDARVTWAPVQSGITVTAGYGPSTARRLLALTEETAAACRVDPEEDLGLGRVHFPEPRLAGTGDRTA
ncbi:hypothetical protein ACFVHW_21755, partial [Streptomyces sp. NPDC127110]|uniref:hypothetical protein n=1 Tax=Streptomyces sp. NPDC127110 TaxID=3345362 RepID=UPI00363FD65D